MGLRLNDGDGFWQGRFSGKGLAQVLGYNGLKQCQRGRVEVLLMGGRGPKRKSAMSNKIDGQDFRVRPGAKVNLKKWPEYQKVLGEHVLKLSTLQRLHYASNRYALLLILQGMDAAGKDGAVRHVMSGFNPQDCWAHSFKQPSSEELEHDFLWRTTRRLPERGQIGIFNRSYYEEVLVVRVHPDNLRYEGLAEAVRDKKNIWEERYRSKYSCTFRRTNSASDSWSASMSRKRTGNSAWRTFTRGDSGRITSRRMRSA